MTQRPRNVRALAVTLGFVVLIVGLLAINPPPCTALVVASSNEKFGLLEDIAKNYNLSPKPVDRRCVRVTVTNKASGDAEEALARGWVESDGALPHVWSPAADTWVLLLSQHRKEAGRSNLVPAVTPDLMLSPLVIGMPKPMADALEADARSRGQGLGWSDMLRHAREPDVWARLNRPEWGPFGLGKTDPKVSTSGLHALIATYHAATGRNDPPTLDDIERFEVREYVKGVESGVVHYAESVRTFLRNLYERDQRNEPYFSALPIEEKQLFEYNRGNPESLWPPQGLPRPRIPLVAVYPVEGTIAANHPYVVLDAPWVEDAHRQAAADFFAHLITPAVQARFCAEGFRDHHGFACTVPAPNGIDPNKPGSYLKLSSPDVLAQMQRSWSGLRKSAQVILAIDVGRSMGDFLPNTNQTKLELAKDAAIAALRRNTLAGADEVGIWAFATNLVGDRAYREVVPLTRVDVGIDRLIDAIRGLQPVAGGKGLYATVLASVFDIRTREKPERIRAVVVLTDGGNDDPRNNDRSGFLDILRRQSDDLRVRVFTIAYAGADAQLLNEIARESGGLFYDATDPKNITDIFRDVISNF